MARIFIVTMPDDMVQTEELFEFNLKSMVWPATVEPQNG